MRTVPLNHAAEVVLGRQRAPQYEEGEGQTPYLRSANIKDGRLDLSDVKSMRFSPGERMRYEVRAGDVLVTEGSGSRDSVGASAVWLGELEGPVCFQNKLLRLRPRAGVSGRYLSWWARHAHASGLVRDAAAGANILHVGAEAMRCLPLALPTVEEQQRIADFLDDQVAQLDAARAGLTQQVAVVHEARTSLLVTAYGIAPSPDLLEGYTSDDVLPIRALTHRFIAGGTPSTDDVRYWDDEGSPWVSIGDMVDGGLTTCTAKGLTSDGLAAARLSLVPSGTVLFAMYASVGKTTVTAMPCTWNQAILGLLPRAQVDTDFLLGWLELIRPVLPFIARSSTQANLNADQVGRLRVPRRDYATQERIGEERRRVIEQTGCSAQSAQHVSSLLEERKRALITACVTGEFDVSSASGRAQP